MFDEELTQDFYTIEEVSKLLKTSYDNIYDKVRQGKLKAAKVGKSWRISRSSLMAFLKENLNVDQNPEFN